MDKKMFELNLFENAEKKDLLDTPITESEAEFAPGSAAAPTEHIDANLSKEQKVTADPAEKPAAKPADGEMGPVNAQTQPEAPKAKPYDAASVSVPGKVTMTADQYNQAIDQLQKSFESGVAILKQLHENVEIISEEAITDAEKDALKVVTEMAETKPEQFNEWSITTLFAKPGIFAVIKEAAAKKEVDLDKDKTFNAALKDVAIITEKLEALVTKVKDLSDKSGAKDLSKKVDTFAKQFDKLMNGKKEESAE